MQERVAREVAEQEFERMCTARRLCTDPNEMDADDATSFEEVRKQIVRAIQRGELVITDEGDPIYTPPVPGSKPLTFYRPTGATFLAMDARGPNESNGNQARMVRALTEMTRSGKGEIAKLEAPDYQLCTNLAQLFLAPR